jgi:hypothetical protein
VKKRGLRVIRARVTPVSRLIGRTAADIDFRGIYKAAIVAVQKGGKNINKLLSTVVFEAGDSLILQASDDSPLLKLKPPSKDFYRKLAEELSAPGAKLSRPTSVASLVNMVLSRKPSHNEESQSSLELDGSGSRAKRPAGTFPGLLPHDKMTQAEDGLADAQMDQENKQGSAMDEESAVPVLEHVVSLLVGSSAPSH